MNLTDYQIYIKCNAIVNWENFKITKFQTTISYDIHYTQMFIVLTTSFILFYFNLYLFFWIIEFDQFQSNQINEIYLFKKIERKCINLNFKI